MVGGKHLYGRNRDKTSVELIAISALYLVFVLIGVSVDVKYVATALVGLAKIFSSYG